MMNSNGIDTLLMKDDILRKLSHKRKFIQEYDHLIPK